MKKLFLIFIIFINLFLVKNTFAGTYTVFPKDMTSVNYIDNNLFFNEGYLWQENFSGNTKIHFSNYSNTIQDTWTLSDYAFGNCDLINKGFVCMKNGEGLYIDIFNDNNNTYFPDFYSNGGIFYDYIKNEWYVYYISNEDSNFLNIFSLKEKQIKYTINYPVINSIACNTNGADSINFSKPFIYYGDKISYVCEFGGGEGNKIISIADRTLLATLDSFMMGGWGFDSYIPFPYKYGGNMLLKEGVEIKAIKGTNNYDFCLTKNLNRCSKLTPDGFYSSDFGTYYKPTSTGLIINTSLSSAGSFVYCKEPYFGIPTLADGTYTCETPETPPPSSLPPPPTGANSPNPSLGAYPTGSTDSNVCQTFYLDNNSWSFDRTLFGNKTNPSSLSPTYIDGYTKRFCIYPVGDNDPNLTLYQNKTCPLSDKSFYALKNDVLYWVCRYDNDPPPPTPPEDPTAPTAPSDPTAPTAPSDPTAPTPPPDPIEPETSFIGSALSYIGDKLGNAFSFVGDMLGYIGDKLGNAFSFVGDMLGYIGDKIGNAFTYIGNVILSVFEGIGSGISKIGDFFSYIMSLFNALSDAVNTFWDFLKSIMEIGQIAFIPNTYADVSPIATLLNSGTTSFLKGETAEVESISDIVKTMKWGIYFIFIILILSIFFIVVYNQKK